MTITARATCASVAVTASLAVAWGVCQIGGAPRGPESSAAPRELSAQAVREADSLDLSFADVTVRPAALIEAAQPPRPTVVKPAESNEPEHLRVGQASQSQPNAKITLGAPSDEPNSSGTQFVIRGIAAPPKAGALKAPGRGIVKRKTNFATPGIAAAPVPGSAAHDERHSDQIDQETPQVVAKPSHTAKQHLPAKPDLAAKPEVTAKPEATAKTQITSDPESTDRVAEQTPAPSKHDPATPSQSRLKVAQKSPAATAKTAPEAIEPTAPSQTESKPRSEATAKIAAAPPAESRLKISARPPVKVKPHKPALKVQAPASPPLLAAKEPVPAAVRPEPAPVVEKTEPLADVAVEKSMPAVESVVEAEPVPAELAAPQASQSAAVPAHAPKADEPVEKREVAQREIAQAAPSAPAAAPEPVVPQPAIKSEPVVAAPAIQAAPPAVEREAQRELAKVDAPAAPEVMPEDPPADVADVQNPAQTRLPLARTAAKSPELVAAVRRADERVRHGFDLAARGALYAGKTEFVSAVKLIAQAYDAHEGTRHYSKAAAAGITALRESADFVRQSQRLAETDVTQIIAHHSTPVLKDKDTSDLPANAAAHAYYTYAQEQLAAAVAGEPCGSMALFGMGKVAMFSSKTTNANLEQTGQAIALYRAAMIAGPQNYQAANELGVMLAENGQLELARDLLIRSVAVSPQVTTWKNLAVVHKRAGEGDLAKRAESQALALQKTRPAPSDVPNVQWVDPATFSSTSSSTDSIPVANASKKQSPAPAKPSVEVARTPNEAPKKGIGEILGLSPRR